MFETALKKSCLTSAIALGDDIKKVSWLMSNQARADHQEKVTKVA
jgi:hypothetical protein